MRIIAATHRNLEESITRGAFREDLFYRLNVFPIEMPALRTRIEDLPTLIRDFSAMNAAAGRGAVRLSVSALECLRLHPWPGNVRELGNLIERMSILCAGRLVTAADLPARYRPRDWTPEAEADLVPALQPAPQQMTAPEILAPVQAARPAEPEMSEREALLLLEEPAAAGGTTCRPAASTCARMWRRSRNH